MSGPFQGLRREQGAEARVISLAAPWLSAGTADDRLGVGGLLAGALPVDGSPTECTVRSPTATAGSEARFIMHPFHRLLPSSRLYRLPTGRGRKSYSVCISWTQGNREAAGLCGEGPLRSGLYDAASVPALSRCAALGGGHSAFPGCHPS